MASVKNDWVGYLDRSFQQIKTSVLSRLSIAVPEMTDYSASNIFIIFLDIFSALAEMLGFYIDTAARESFIVTALRKSSVIKLSRGLDYRVKGASAESVDLTITWNAPIGSTFTLTSGFTITGTGGIVYRLLQDVSVLGGSTTTIIPLSQVALVNLSTSTDGSKNQKITLGTSYVNASIQLVVDGDSFDEVSTFANSSPTSKEFIVEILEDGIAYAILGDGYNGVLPTSGVSITGTYQNTLAELGKVGAGGFDDSTIALGGSLPMGVSITDANSVINSSGGASYESLENIRNNAVLSIRTIDRMVTRSDHRFVINTVPGVAKSEVDFNCGKIVNIYIVPAGGGIASGTLLAAAQVVADDSKIVGMKPIAIPAGITRLILGTHVTAKKRKSLVDTKTQVDNALLDFGSVENQEINGAIRMSDLQALIDDLSNVDFVDIVKMYTIPYARPLLTNTNPLIWINETTSLSLINVSWRLEYNGSAFTVFRENIYLGTIAIGAEFVAPGAEFKFTIGAGTYVTGNQWSFVVMPYMQNLQLVDFTIFTIEIDDIENTIFPAAVN